MPEYVSHRSAGGGEGHSSGAIAENGCEIDACRMLKMLLQRSIRKVLGEYGQVAGVGYPL